MLSGIYTPIAQHTGSSLSSLTDWQKQTGILINCTCVDATVPSDPALITELFWYQVPALSHHSAIDEAFPVIQVLVLHLFYSTCSIVCVTLTNTHFLCCKTNIKYMYICQTKPQHNFLSTHFLITSYVYPLVIFVVISFRIYVGSIQDRCDLLNTR